MPKKTTPPTFTAQQSTLSKALSICSKALSDNKILPVYEMFLFAIDGNKLDISSCDGRIIISTSIDIKSMALQINLCIPGRKLQDYISKSANELLSFEIDKHVTPEIRETKEHPTSGEPYEVVTPEKITYSITVKTTSGKCTIPCELGDNFPEIANIDPRNFTLPADNFLGMLNRMMFAISDDQLRPSATGLNVHIEPGKVTTTALDFNQVATYTAASELDFKHSGFIIPKKALQQIQSLSPTGMLNMSVSKSALSINWGDIKTTALLIDEKYPDYLAVTPTDNAIDFVTSRSALINSLKRVLPFSDVGKLVKLEIEADALLLTAENIDYSEQATETIPGALANGDAIVIGANGEFLLGILNSLTDDKVWFSFSAPNRAMIITDGGKHVNPGKENLVLLMPLFIQ